MEPVLPDLFLLKQELVLCTVDFGKFRSLIRNNFMRLIVTL
jgi:hypothetical protein